MKKIFLIICLSICLFAKDSYLEEDTSSLSVSTTVSASSVSIEKYEKGKILDVVNFDQENIQALKIKILNGKNRGQEIFVKNYLTGNKSYDVKVSINDLVLLWQDDYSNPQYAVADFIRERGLWLLLSIFLLLILLLGKWQGLKSLTSLFLTIVLIYIFLLPLIIKGFNPIIVSIVICAVVALISFLLISGFTLKSLTAILGTVGGVTVAGILALAVGKAIHLTGLASEESRLLIYSMAQSTNFQGILFSGIIIGSLGAVMDVAISIASAVDELKKHKPQINSQELFDSAINVGRDMMSTMTNTLILAYTGSALPLLILFKVNQISFIKGINLDLVATEIVRSLAGSIGLISAIPITAYLASYVLHKQAADMFK